MGEVVLRVADALFRHADRVFKFVDGGIAPACPILKSWPD